MKMYNYRTFFVILNVKNEVDTFQRIVLQSEWYPDYINAKLNMKKDDYGIMQIRVRIRHTKKDLHKVFGIK